jgi:phytoene dehydrogenase-like protein
MSRPSTDIIIVGAGPAGLTCARSLHKYGRQAVILEAEDRIGGRLQTDSEEGYLFDRGFQVLQLAYPAAQQLLDYTVLDLHRFPPGVRIRSGGKFRILADPLRRPKHFLQTLTSGIGTTADRLRLIRLARQTSRPALEDIFIGKELTVLDFLRNYGFSQAMIEQFFRPFMAGVCLDPKIRTSHRFLLFVLRMFTLGDVAVPADGMAEIPKQIAADLPPDTVRLNTPVEKVEKGRVHLQSGETITSEVIILATSAPATARLLGGTPLAESCRELCLYYSADKAPFEEPFLTLNGEGSGLINSVNFPSMVAPNYAPANTNLISVVVPGFPHSNGEEIEIKVRRELTQWFGDQADDWKYLRAYEINHALPRVQPPTPNPFDFEPHLGDGLFDCGESRTLPAIQWALQAGHKTATSVNTYLSSLR